MGLSSCGHDLKLVSITIIPDGTTLVGPGVELQFKALGNYIHPPESKDITKSVVWVSAAPQIVTVDANGLAVSQNGCGTNITITASVFSDPANQSGSVIIGTAAVNVTQPGVCP